MSRGKATKLDFVMNIQRPVKRGFTLEKAYVFVEALKKMDVFKAAEMAKKVGLSEFACSLFFKELKIAGEKEYTLERYMREGRPFRSGKKVLA